MTVRNSIFYVAIVVLLICLIFGFTFGAAVMGLLIGFSGYQKVPSKAKAFLSRDVKSFL